MATAVNPDAAALYASAFSALRTVPHLYLGRCEKYTATGRRQRCVAVILADAVVVCSSRGGIHRHMPLQHIASVLEFRHERAVCLVAGGATPAVPRTAAEASPSPRLGSSGHTERPLSSSDDVTSPVVPGQDGPAAPRFKHLTSQGINVSANGAGGGPLPTDPVPFDTPHAEELRAWSRVSLVLAAPSPERFITALARAYTALLGRPLPTRTEESIPPSFFSETRESGPVLAAPPKTPGVLPETLCDALLLAHTTAATKPQGRDMAAAAAIARAEMHPLHEASAPLSNGEPSVNAQATLVLASVTFLSNPLQRRCFASSGASAEDPGLKTFDGPHVVTFSLPLSFVQGFLEMTRCLKQYGSDDRAALQVHGPLPPPHGFVMEGSGSVATIPDAPVELLATSLHDYAARAASHTVVVRPFGWRPGLPSRFEDAAFFWGCIKEAQSDRL